VEPRQQLSYRDKSGVIGDFIRNRGARARDLFDIARCEKCAGQLFVESEDGAFDLAQLGFS